MKAWLLSPAAPPPSGKLWPADMQHGRTHSAPAVRQSCMEDRPTRILLRVRISSKLCCGLVDKAARRNYCERHALIPFAIAGFVRWARDDCSCCHRSLTPYRTRSRKVKDCLITAIGSARGASGSIRSLGGEQNWWWLSAVVPSLDVMVRDLGNLPRRSLGETARPSDGNAECREFQHRGLRCRAGLKPGILLGRHSVTASAGFVDKVNGGCVTRRRSRSFEPAGERWGRYLPEQTVALRERHCSPAIWEFLYPSFIGWTGTLAVRRLPHDDGNLALAYRVRTKWGRNLETVPGLVPSSRSFLQIGTHNKWLARSCSDTPTMGVEMQCSSGSRTARLSRGTFDNERTNIERARALRGFPD